MSMSTSIPFEIEVGQKSGLRAKGLKPTRDQKPTAEALKTQEV